MLYSQGMTTALQRLRGLASDSQGATHVEYAAVLAALAIACSVTVSILAETMGIRRCTLRERRVDVSTVLREATLVRWGTSNASS